MRARAVEFALELHEKNAALVTHAGVMRALVGHWNGLAQGEWTRLEFDFCAFTTIEV
jgi:broad specificity phosphatase PhoE